MKRFILLLLALVPVVSALKGQNQTSVPSITILPVFGQTLQVANSPFRQYLANNYQNENLLFNWSKSNNQSDVTRSTGNGTMIFYQEIAYGHDIWSGPSNEWNSNDSGAYQYNSDGMVDKFITFQTSSAGGFTNSVMISYDYNGSWKEVKYLNQTWNARGENWENVSKFTYTYDDQNRCISAASSIWNVGNSAWTPNDRYDYGYDSSDNEAAQLYEIWDANSESWVQSYIDHYTYDQAHQMLSYVNEIWTDSAWVNSQKIIYTYNPGGKVSSLTTQIWASGAWMNYDMDTGAFNYDGNLAESVSLIWNPGANVWVNNSETIYSYDANDNNVLMIGYNWARGQWDSSTYVERTYNYANEVTSQENADFVNSVRLYTTRYQNIYDEYNRKTSTTNYNWDKGANNWNAVSMYSYNYDNNGNVVYQLNQNWSSANNDFVNAEQYYFYYTPFKTTAINTATNDFGAAIYPNPSTSSAVNLRLNITDETQVEITVYDALGRPVSSQILPVIAGDNAITLGSSGIAAGNYFVQLVGKTDGKTCTLKFEKL